MGGMTFKPLLLSGTWYFWTFILTTLTSILSLNYFFFLILSYLIFHTLTLSWTQVLLDKIHDIYLTLRKSTHSHKRTIIEKYSGVTYSSTLGTAGTDEKDGEDETNYLDSTPRYHLHPHDIQCNPACCEYLKEARYSPNPECSPDSPSPSPSPSFPPAMTSSTVAESPPTKANNVDPREKTAVSDVYESSTLGRKKEGGVIDSREGMEVLFHDSERFVSPPCQNIGPEHEGGGKETWEEAQWGCSIQVKTIDWKGNQWWAMKWSKSSLVPHLVASITFLSNSSILLPWSIHCWHQKTTVRATLLFGSQRAMSVCLRYPIPVGHCQ